MNAGKPRQKWRIKSGTGIHRATEARVQASAAVICELLERDGNSSSYGPASQHYWTISHARQLEDTPLDLPTNATFTQLQRVDALQSEITAAQDNQTQQFVRVACQINGGIIHLDLDINDLWRALGLPSHDLFPPFRADFSPTMPAENVNDDEHTEIVDR
ncbi:hypothetical protein PHMEG_0009742 [Phytophthora megakarya]|uniref:Uncharacterized protein n=1 Tax=Phytophthora megakarya TaxID=4795 RepID=A0A225WGT6_9STRA|nr:hypothetical protein PHMEG_0009742 [Phytophthora megakarya]